LTVDLGKKSKIKGESQDTQPPIDLSKLINISNEKSFNIDSMCLNPGVKIMAEDKHLVYFFSNGIGK
jgi:hypothetical protein